MGKEYFDRYQSFKFDGNYIPRSRLDKLSQIYYDNPYHGWLILLSNPQYGGVEENIPNREIIRIPFPFRDSIQQYIDEVEKYKKLYIQK